MAHRGRRRNQAFGVDGMTRCTHSDINFIFCMDGVRKTFHHDCTAANRACRSSRRQRGKRRCPDTGCRASRGGWALTDRASASASTNVGHANRQHRNATDHERYPAQPTHRKTCNVAMASRGQHDQLGAPCCNAAAGRMAAGPGPAGAIVGDVAAVAALPWQRTQSKPVVLNASRPL